MGFAPQCRAVDLTTGERRTVEIATMRAAQTLALVNIVGRGSRVDMTGFEDRRKVGIGHFISNDVRPYDVRGTEVDSERSAAPPEYRASSLEDSGRPDTHCAVILIWTKPRAQQQRVTRTP